MTLAGYTGYTWIDAGGRPTGRAGIVETSRARVDPTMGVRTIAPGRRRRRAPPETGRTIGAVAQSE